MNTIFLHGMGQTASSWEKTIACLPHQDGILCPELSHFFSPGNCTYNSLYTAFCTYCDGFSEPFNLCGLSLGAVLALHYTIDHPENVNSLVLIAPQYNMPKFLLWVQNLLFQFMPEGPFQDIGLKKLDFITLTNSMADMDLTSGLDHVKCPVLAACGDRDSANKKAARTLAKKLPKAEFVTIPHSGHEVNVDAPEALACAIKLFFAQSQASI